ncbi:MAG: TldD/PmbA family protein, partial [Candidatus Hodarchaeales archaeon]
KSGIEKAISFAKKIDPSILFSGVEDRKSIFPKVNRVYDDKIDHFIEESPEHVNNAINAALDAGGKRIAGSLLFGLKRESFISSKGIEGSFKSTFYELTVRAFQNDLDSSGQGISCSCMLDNVTKEFDAAGTRAGELSKAHRNCRQGKAGVYDLILSPAVAGNLFGGLLSRANPIPVLTGMSPFSDMVGEQIAPEFLNADDNGLIDNGLETAPHDFEGTPHQKTPIIKDGVLQGFVHNTSTAKLYDTVSTGNSRFANMGISPKILAPSSTNRVFNNGDHSFDELLEGDSRSKPTLYITCNWYTRFTSYTSTEFSTIPRDAMFLIENGEIGKPLKNVRISDNQLRMLKNITAMGNDRVQAKWWVIMFPTWIPTIRISDCRITTATQ